LEFALASKFNSAILTDFASFAISFLMLARVALLDSRLTLPALERRSTLTVGNYFAL
jgi:hypothetical protein